MDINKKEKPCNQHGVILCQDCMKRLIYQILYMSMDVGNGGFSSQFGMVALKEMLDVTRYDLKDNFMVKLINTKE
jgi:hypothetical protein